MNMDAALGVVVGYASVALVLLIGYAARRFGIVGEQTVSVLNRVTLMITTPCLYFTILARSDASVLVSPFSLASLLPILVVGAIVALLRRRSTVAETTMVVGTSVYTNVGNIGIPIATSVLGSTGYIAPMILLQVLVVSPVLLIVLELTRGGGADESLGRVISRPFLNPIIVSAILGLIVVLVGLELPDVVLQPFDMVGDAAIPIMLLAFGMSLSGMRSATGSGGRRSDLWLAVVGKVLLMPAATLGAALLLGLEGQDLVAIVVIATLPTAQNIYAIAENYGVLGRRVRDIVLLSTAISFPAAFLAAGLLG